MLLSLTKAKIGFFLFILSVCLNNARTAAVALLRGCPLNKDLGAPRFKDLASAWGVDESTRNYTDDWLVGPTTRLVRSLAYPLITWKTGFSTRIKVPLPCFSIDTRSNHSYRSTYVIIWQIVDVIYLTDLNKNNFFIILIIWPWPTFKQHVPMTQVLNDCDFTISKMYYMKNASEMYPLLLEQFYNIHICISAW